MNTPGYLSIERDRAPWSKAVSDGYLSVVAVGVLAGILVAYARTPMHLPGHKAVLWMAPVLCARMVAGVRAGASAGALTTAVTTFVLGGRLAGGLAMMPLIVLAGVVFDLAVQLAERRKFAWWQYFGFFVLAGLIGNLICFVKRLFDPMGAFFSAGNIEDCVLAGGYHAVFGALAGLIGVGSAYALLKFRAALSK
jgi:hypothetical protein